MRNSSISVRRVLEVSANVGIVIVSIILIGNFVWSKIHAKRVLTSGSNITLPGVKWDDGTTLVLALQKGCRFCDESAPFYQRLREQRSGSQPRIIAVVPGEKDAGAKYLQELGIVVDDTVNVSLSEIHVAATPTIFLVDRTGKVSNVWVGKLDAAREKEVVERVFQ